MLTLCTCRSVLRCDAVRCGALQWMAPNLVTLLGTSCLLLQCVVVVWQSPNLQGPLPWWACLLAALCNFLYSTLDAMDGKQARRTKSSSPLGQLFDHGTPPPPPPR